MSQRLGTARARWVCVVLWALVMSTLALNGSRVLLEWLDLAARRGQTLRLGRNLFYSALHAGGFGLLGVLVVWALRAGEVTRRRLVASIALIALFAALLEGLQAFVPRRTVDPWDLLANATGAVAGFGLMSLTPWGFVGEREAAVGERAEAAG